MTRSKLGTAGYSTGTYSRPVPLLRMAPVGMMRVPGTSVGSMAPQVPTRMRTSAPHFFSSSTPMAVLGPPMPVDMTVTVSPSRVPFQVVYSR